MSYVAFSVGTIPRETARFREIVSFQRLVLFIMRAPAEQIPSVRENLLRELAPLNPELTLVRVGES